MSGPSSRSTHETDLASDGDLDLVFENPFSDNLAAFSDHRAGPI